MYFHEPTGQCYELYKQGKNILALSSYHFMYLFVYIFQVPVQKATFCHSIMAVCPHSVNVKTIITYILMGNAIN